MTLLQSLVEVLLFYHPAVWWLSARIRAERELCCDDVAAALCGDPLILARALTDLEALREPLSPSPTHLALAANGGSLMHRVRHLLHPALPITSGARATALALLAASLLGAAGVALQDKDKEPAPRPGKDTRMKVLDGDRQLDVRMKGDVQLNGEAPDPVAVPGDGSFRVEEKKGGKARTYAATKDKATYTVDGQEQPLDKDGKDWLREVLRSVKRNQSGRERVTEVRIRHMDGRERELDALVDKARAEGRRVQVEVIEKMGEGPGTVIIHKEGDGDPQLEMAAIRAELKALQSRLEQLQKQMATPPKPPKAPKPPKPPKNPPAPEPFPVPLPPAPEAPPAPPAPPPPPPVPPPAPPAKPGA